MPFGNNPSPETPTTGNPPSLLDRALGLVGFGKGSAGGLAAEAMTQGAESLPTTELDKTQAALEELKNGIAADQALQGLIDRVRTAFYHDLAERADIDESQYPAYWGRVGAKIEEYLKAAMQHKVETTPEFQDINAFIDNVENFSRLTASSSFQWIGNTLRGVPFAADMLYGFFQSWADSGKEENDGKDTMLGRYLRRWANALKPEEAAANAVAAIAAARATQTPSATPAAAAGAPETPEAAETSAFTPHVAALMKELKISETDPEAIKDYEELQKKPYKDKLEEFADAAKGVLRSPLKKIYKTANDILGMNDSLKPRLLDVRLMALGRGERDKIAQAIEDANKPDKKSTAAKVREFLTAINEFNGDSIETAKAKLT